MFVDNNVIRVIPVALTNDGNLLKPGIKYDERLKRNVGLDIKCDAEYIKNNPQHPDPEWLKSHFISEVLVTYVTSLYEEDALPICADYVAKLGKSSSEMKTFFTERINTLQMCSLCVKKAKSDGHIISDYNRCKSFCQDCYEGKSVCEQRVVYEQTSHP